MGRDAQRGGDEQRGEGRGRRSQTSMWEWVVGVASGVLLLAILAFLVYEGVASPTSPPRLEVQVDSIRAMPGGGFLVELRLRNRGQATAAAVLVEGELQADTGTVETSQVTVDYVPARSSRKAGLIFTHDPRLHSLSVRPHGYDVP